MLPIMDNTRILEAGGAAAGGLALLLYRWRANLLPKQIQEEKYQGGEPYADPPVVQTGLLTDLKAMGGLRKIISSAQVLFDLAKNKGKPDDDKKMTVSYCHYNSRLHQVIH